MLSVQSRIGRPDDDAVLNTTHTGKAEFIVTGNKHLLRLGRFKKQKS